MMHWLDPLGALKWPSLLIILSPLAAYPFWLPEAVFAERCGQVSAGGQRFDVYRAADGNELVLRPAASAGSDAPPTSARLLPNAAVRFDAGGMVIDTTSLEGAQSLCTGGGRGPDVRPGE